MRFGLRVPNTGPLATVENMLATCRAAERLGYDSLWVSDHVFIPLEVRSRYPFSASGRFPAPPGTPVFEPIPVLAWIAGVTRRVEIGVNVLIVPYRNPVVTAKQLATIDVLSGGRLALGIGVGWMKEEFDVLRAEPYEQRGRVTDEYVQLWKELWTAEVPSFKGRYYEVSGITFEPRPPHPIPILVGGVSDAALRRVARYGDGWHAWTTLPEGAARDVARLRSMVEAEGRDPAAIRVMMGNAVRLQRPGAPAIEITEFDGPEPVVGTAEQVIETMRAYDTAGIHEFALLVRSGPYSAVLELIEEFMEDVGRKVNS